MFCTEEGVLRELYWAGFGFQVWCQLLTHIERAGAATVLAIDEPEIYLHPDVQRQLLAILRDSGPSILMATHSSELVAEAEPSEILLVDKKSFAARRITKRDGVVEALRSLGSIQNLALTKLARTRRVLFLEGDDDFSLLSIFAKRLGMGALSLGENLTVIPLNGFPTPERVVALTDGIRQALGTNDLSFSGVFDRDYRCDEEIEHLLVHFRKALAFVRIDAYKEIENRILVPSAIDRAIQAVLVERARLTRRPVPDVTGSEAILEAITNEMKVELQSQYVGFGLTFFQRDRRDKSTLTADLLRRFEAKWNDDRGRLQVVAGKETLRRLNDRLQSAYGVSLSARRIALEMRLHEIDPQLQSLLREIDNFRTSDPSATERNA